jgi:hypothetical protein
LFVRQRTLFLPSSEAKLKGGKKYKRAAHDCGKIALAAEEALARSPCDSYGLCVGGRNLPSERKFPLSASIGE